VVENPSDDRRLLEDKLDKAMEEAWSKLNIAVKSTAGESGESEMAIRLAAEAAEYSSALFSLRYGLEDLDPEVKIAKGRDSLGLVKDSVEALRRARELRPKSVTEAYSSLRTAADYLKTAYLDRVKKTAKKSS
jgi:hypothetical protein